MYSCDVEQQLPLPVKIFWTNWAGKGFVLLVHTQHVGQQLLSPFKCGVATKALQIL